jgi:hypothetical protein
MRRAGMIACLLFSAPPTQAAPVRAEGIRTLEPGSCAAAPHDSNRNCKLDRSLTGLSGAPDFEAARIVVREFPTVAIPIR